MDMPQKNEAFELFVKDATWTQTKEGWRREQMDGIDVYLLNLHGDFCQAIANRGTCRPHYSDPFRLDGLATAKEFAWHTFKKMREARPDNVGINF